MCFVNRCRLRPTTVLIVLLVVVNVAPHMGHRPQIFILCLGLCWSHFAQISRSSSYLSLRRCCAHSGLRPQPSSCGSPFFNYNTIFCLHAYPGFHVSW
jgi:hypothetical protein